MKRKIVQWLSLLLALSLLLSVLPPLGLEAAAAEPVIYDASDYPALSHTAQEVAERLQAARQVGASFQDGNPDTYYVRPASTVAPYDQGVVTQDLLDAMVAMQNYLRWLTGAAPLKQGCVNNDSLQRQALIRNFQFGHYVDDENKPADMDQDFWDAGAIIDHNIIAGGYTPRGVMSGWCDEGYNIVSKQWDTVGHRAALLDPSYSSIELGFAGRIAIGKCGSKTNSLSVPFTAYPAPNPMPYNLVSAREAAWDLYLNAAQFQSIDAQALSVTITGNDGSVFTRTTAEGTLTPYGSLHFAFVQPEYTDGYHYPVGRSYDVHVTGLTDKATGKPAEIWYTVKFFEPRAFEPTVLVGIEPKDFPALVVDSAMADETHLELLRGILPDRVELTTGNGMKLELPLVNGWTLEPEHHCWSAEVDSSSLPETISDPYELLPRVTLSYYVNSNNAKLELDAAPALAQPGSFLLNDASVHTDVFHAGLFQIQGSGVGRQAVLRFDETDGNYALNGRNIRFDVDAWQPTDSGEWFLLYRKSEDAWYYSDTSAYVTNTVTVDIPCLHAQTQEEAKAPSCTEAGYRRLRCLLCGELLEDLFLRALGHDWSEGEITTPPSASADGVMTYCCARCGTVKTEPISRNPFLDVKEGKYYYKPVLWAYYHEPRITGGTGDGEFSPNATCTREQIVSFLYNANNKPAFSQTECPFSDVIPGKYYYKPVMWAVENKITGGMTDTLFGVGQPCTREQAVTFLWKAAGSPAPQSSECSFTDVKVGAYYYKAVLWAVENGITGGIGDGLFGVGQPCTRAQIVTFLYKAYVG